MTMYLMYSLSMVLVFLLLSYKIDKLEERVLGLEQTIKLNEVFENEVDD